MPRAGEAPILPDVESTAAVEGGLGSGMREPPPRAEPHGPSLHLGQRDHLKAALRAAAGACQGPATPAADSLSPAYPRNERPRAVGTKPEQVVVGGASVITRIPAVQQVSFFQPLEQQATQAEAEQVGGAPETIAPNDVPEPIPAAEWTLHELQQIALECNPTLVQASAAVRAAEGRYVQEGLYPNPRIGYAGGDIGMENTSGQQGMVFSQQIVTKHKLCLARAVAGYDIERASYDLDARRQRVLNDVRKAYYEVLIAQEMVDVAKRLVEIGEEVVEVNERLFQQLEKSRLVVLRSRIEADAAKLSLSQAESASQAAWRRLAAVIGQPEIPQQPLGGDPYEGIVELTWEEAVDSLLTQSPELAMAYTGVERARTEVTRQCAESWPNLQIGSWIKYDETLFDTLLDVEVAMPLPIFDRNQGAIMNAESALIIAEREVRRVELSLTNRLASVFERYDIARRQMQIYKQRILPDSQKALDLAKAGYREGELSYLDLLVAQVTYFDASLDSLTRLDELWASSIELEGLLLGGSLNSLQ
jgi:cobalt-zinc-cadmium efflux system outer membrane protein